MVAKFGLDVFDLPIDEYEAFAIIEDVTDRWKWFQAQNA